MAECDECTSKFKQLYDKLTAVFDGNDIKSLTIKSQLSSDHTTLEIYFISEDEFANLVI